MFKVSHPPPETFEDRPDHRGVLWVQNFLPVFLPDEYKCGGSGVGSFPVRADGSARLNMVLTWFSFILWFEDLKSGIGSYQTGNRK